MNKSIVYSIISAIIFIVIFSLAIVIKNKNNKIKELDSNIELLNKTKNLSEGIYSKATALADSALDRNEILSTFESLTLSMIYRDSIRKFMKYKVGDIVFLKPDSTKAVVKDILIGGSKYEYYMKYQVVRNDNNSEILSPELVY